MMRALVFCLAALCLAAPAGAQSLPAPFQVTGVAQDDALNIRAEPSANAEILGEIDAYDLAVEVLRLSEDGKWGMVGAGRQWLGVDAVLAYDARPNPYAIPRPLTCSGHEPFWSIGLTPRGAEFQTPEIPRTDIEVTSEGVAERGF